MTSKQFSTSHGEAPLAKIVRILLEIIDVLPILVYFYLCSYSLQNYVRVGSMSLTY
jgi:hypothetical protein